jgi:arsenate reductase
MTYRVLFLCTGNSARSIIAESVLRKLGAGKFEALSAGSHPAGQPNPYALEALKRAGYPTDNLRSKSWDEFADGTGATLDFVITVCDNAKGEVCPVWPGQPMNAHWGVPDPAAYQGTQDQIRHEFFKTLVVLERRIQLFTALKHQSLDRISLKRRMDEIGREQVSSGSEA